MASQHEIRAGQVITLRSQFKDDLGDYASADYAHINIYDPTVTTYLPANATVASGTPTYLGNGIYSYDYSVPLAGPDGIWHHQWNGDLTVQRISAIFPFEVTASGTIYEIPSQLFNNNIVTIDLVSGLRATDRTELSSEYSFSFLTTLTPVYTSTRKIRLRAGAYFRNIPDDTLQLMNLEASLEADALTWSTDTNVNHLFEHARREYTTCLASYILLQNSASSSLRSKTLGDLSVEYDTKGLQNALGDLKECMGKWEGQVLAHGLAKASTQPQGVVKGEYDPDRPVIGRLWETGSDSGNNVRVPAANRREQPVGKRRSIKTYMRRWW